MSGEPSRDAAGAESRARTNRQWVAGLLVSAAERQWFGTITIQIRRGTIDLVKSEETLKPPQKNGDADANRADKKSQ